MLCHSTWIEEMNTRIICRGGVIEMKQLPIKSPICHLSRPAAPMGERYQYYVLVCHNLMRLVSEV